jgi:ABC-type dipeptide/oligopeptide/nickel transport system permease component
MYTAQTQRSNWWGFIGKKVVFAVVAFIFVSMLLFVIATPKPVIYHVTPDTTKEEYERIRNLANYQVYRNYPQWISGIFQGDFGISISSYPWLTDSK